jgi:Major tropism determinant N-terminal domain
MAEEKKIVKLQVRRGPEAQLPLLSEGEIAVTIDTSKVFYGTGTENFELGRADILNSLVKQLDLITSASSIDPAVEQMKVGREGRTYDSAREMVLGESTSAVVNTIQPLLERELPSAYPIGVTAFKVDSEDLGFPTSLGTILTVKVEDTRITQCYTAKVSGQTWIRTAGSTSEWTEWARSASLADVNAVDSAQVNTVDQQPASSGPELYQLGVTIFNTDTTDLGYPEVSGTVVTNKMNNNRIAQTFTHKDSARVWVRTGIGSTWTEWNELETTAGAQKKVDELKEWVRSFGIGDGARAFLSEKVDLNTVINSGNYRLASGHPNMPHSDVEFGQLAVIRGGATSIVQLAFNWKSPVQMWVRVGNPPDIEGSGSWSEWEKTANVSEVLKKTGGVLSGVLSFDTIEATPLELYRRGSQSNVNLHFKHDRAEGYLGIDREGRLKFNRNQNSADLDGGANTFFVAAIEDITSEKVNSLPNMSVAETDPLSKYPIGISVMRTGGWYPGYGTVITFRNNADNIGHQIFFRTDRDNPTMSTRYYNSDGWTSWNQNETTAGALSKVREGIDAITPSQITNVETKPATNSVDSYKQGITAFNISSDASNQLGYPFNYGEALNIIFNKNRAFQILADKEERLFFRIANEVYNNQWSEFIELETVSGAQKKVKDYSDKIGWGIDRQGVYGTNGESLSDITVAGSYSISTHSTDRPPGLTQGGFLIHQVWVDLNYAKQQFSPLDENSLYIRTKAGNIWNDWTKLG